MFFCVVCALLCRLEASRAARVTHEVGGSSRTFFDVANYDRIESGNEDFVSNESEDLSEKRAHFPIVWAAGFMQQALEVRVSGGPWKLLWGPFDHPERFIARFAELAFPNGDNVEVRPYLGMQSFDASGLFFKDLPKVVERLERYGYEKGKNLLGHAYDWRVGVKGWKKDSYPVLKKDIEAAVERSKGKRMVISSISLGGLYMHAFFRWVGKRWVKKYVEAFVPYGASWAGSCQPLQFFFKGVLRSGTDSIAGECPACNPPSEKAELQPPGFMKYAPTTLVSILDKLALRATMRSLPGFYQVMPSIDYSPGSTVPDRVVLSLREDYTPHPKCVGKPTETETYARCGMLRTQDNYLLGSGFLTDAQCAQCEKLSRGSDCSEGFLSINSYSFRTVCCKKRECSGGRRDYRASELPALFKSLGFIRESSMMAHAQKQKMSQDPGVPVHCVIEQNLKTPQVLRMTKSHGVEGVVMGDGDEVVELASLDACSRWKSTVKTYRVNGVRHASSFKFLKEGLDVLIYVATNDQEKWKAWTTPEYPTNLDDETHAAHGFSNISRLLVAPGYEQLVRQRTTSSSAQGGTSASASASSSPKPPSTKRSTSRRSVNRHSSHSRGGDLNMSATDQVNLVSKSS